MQGFHPPFVRLTLPAAVEYVALSRRVVDGVAVAAGLDASALSDLRIAVGETVANAVVHGSAGAGATVEVVFEALPGAVVVEVADGGRGFDPDGVRSAPAAELPERGLGLALVRALADELEVRAAGPQGGCVVRLVKRAAAAPGAPAPAPAPCA